MKPKVCFVSEGAYPLLADRAGSERVGGAELQQVLLGEELVRRGYEVGFVTPDHDQGREARMGGFRVFGSWRPAAGLPVVRFVYPRLVELWRALLRADADVYLVRTPCKQLATVVAFARRHGRRSVYCGATDSDFEPDRLRLPTALDRRLYVWGLRRCDAVVTQSERQREAVRDHYGRGSVVIHNGYAAPERLVSAGDRALWVATFRAAKQPRALLEVAARLPEMRFVMVGGASWGHMEDPGLFDAVAAEAAELPNLELCGALPLPATEAQFDRAAVVVNTSRDEGFPNTFLQAWSRGIPVISFVDPDGMIGENELGVAVDGIEAMVGALRDLAEGRVRFSREVIRGFFDAHFTIERLGDDYERLLATLSPGR
jgi:glycosyltransferase involved in cell wall biosynthesis